MLLVIVTITILGSRDVLYAQSHSSPNYKIDESSFNSGSEIDARLIQL